MARNVVLQFDPALDRLPSGNRLSKGVSAAVAIGDALWLAHDETVAIECLRRVPGKLRYDGHRRYALHDFVAQPAAEMPHRRARRVVGKEQHREGDLCQLAHALGMK